MKTKNITLKIDEEAYRRARVRAAQMETSVSAMVRDFLAEGNTKATDPDTQRIAALRALYRNAEGRGQAASTPLTPLTREEIYAERLG